MPAVAADTSDGSPVVNVTSHVPVVSVWVVMVSSSV